MLGIQITEDKEHEFFGYYILYTEIMPMLQSFHGCSIRIFISTFRLLNQLIQLTFHALSEDFLNDLHVGLLGEILRESSLSLSLGVLSHA